MSTLVEQAAVATLALLNGAGKPAAVPATERDRAIDAEPTDQPISVFNIGAETVIKSTRSPHSPIVTRTVRWLLIASAPATASVRPSAAVDPILAWYTKALMLMGADGKWLGGLASEIRELGLPPIQELGVPGGRTILRGQKPYCLAVAVYEVDLITRVYDAETG